MKASRPPLEGLYVYLLAAFVGFTIADLSVLYIRPQLLPTEPPPVRPSRIQQQHFSPLSNYTIIVSKNFFSADGKIPPAMGAKGSNEGETQVAVRSNLPLKLLGTIVHADPHRSVATIDITSRSKTVSIATDDEIEGMAHITKIERRKVTFRNLSNGRMEYIEIPEQAKITFGLKLPSNQAPAPQKSNNGIEDLGNHEYSVQRSMVDKYTSNLTKVLRQARMVPNFIPGSGGAVSGFRFVNIEPNSIFDKLGFKVGDSIKSVNGEPVNSPTKAMELFNALRSSSQIHLTVERNGREQDFEYTIQ